MIPKSGNRFSDKIMLKKNQRDHDPDSPLSAVKTPQPIVSREHRPRPRRFERPDRTA
jgi:hypothetical protein